MIKIMWLHLTHPFFFGVFHSKPSVLGNPMAWETPMYSKPFNPNDKPSSTQPGCLVVKGLHTDGGASLEATQGMDLCKGWLRVASRSTLAFITGYNPI